MLTIQDIKVELTKDDDGAVYGYKVGEKTLEICSESTSSMYIVKALEGGQLPKELEGHFTTPMVVESEIVKYANRLEGRKFKNKMEAHKKAQQKKVTKEEK